MKKQSKWAQETMQKPFLIIDLETTSLDGEPVQISVINQDGEVIFSSYLKPSLPISPAASAIHGMTEELLKDMLTFPQIYNELFNTLNGQRVIAYNADFETKILTNTCKLYGLPQLPPVTSCAMLNYAQYHGEKSHRGGYKWQSLINACTQMGIEIKNAHNALGDCLMTLELIKAMAGHEEKPETSEIEALLNRAFAEYGRCEMFVTDIYFIFLTIPNCEVFGRKQKGVITIRENGLTVYNSQEKIYTTGKWEKLIKVMME